ncbi:hypothetical protein LOC67_13130 [Stieleria sp. JC731]|nr:hypothetical protein [Stieleria sp. JC731]MCC9601493.1 hypothetical protein [Stieleria sp. JC731]
MKHTLGYGEETLDASLLQRTLRTPTRCHLAGSLAMFSMFTVCVLCWAKPDWVLRPLEHNETEIDQAIQLISSGTLIRTQYEQSKADHQETVKQIKEIDRWLPRRIDWQEVESQIRRVAREHDVELFRFERGRLEQTSRVGVWNAKLELHGSFPDLTKFIRSTLNFERPFWCCEVSFVRSGKSNRLPNAIDSDCVATLSIRLPMASSETAAQQLFVELEQLTELDHEQ